MVSILFDVIKFLLIYRHLQNTYWFIREISEIRVRPSQLVPCASIAHKYSPNSCKIYFLKHQDSFNSFNSCSKKIVFKNKIRVRKNKNSCSKRQYPCSMHRVICHTCNPCVCARTHPRARMRIFYKVN